MTKRYYDSVNGSIDNNGTDPSTPKRIYASAGTAAGDEFYFKRGTEQVYDDMVTARSGSSEAVKSYFGVYGESDIPYVSFKVAATKTIIMNAAFSKWTVFEDIKFDMDNVVVHPLYCASQSVGGQTSNNVLRRCRFTGSAANGLTIAREDSSTASGPASYVIEDCDFYDNSAHGLIIIAGSNIAVRRCRFWGNGFNVSTGGHGFSARAAHTSAPSGWTQHSGNIWKRTFVAPQTDAFYVRSTPSAPYHLVRNDATPTNLALNEYGVSGSVLYINIGRDPNAQGVTYAYALCSNVTVEDCEAWGNVSDPVVAGSEGHGFVFDDWGDTSAFEGNESHDNEGYGFVINKGGSNRIRSNVAYNNGGPGALVNAADGAVITNNSFFNNNRSALHARNGEVVFSYGSRNGVVSNNMLKGAARYGVDTDPADSGHTGTKNNVNGFVSVDRMGILTSTVTVDPLLDDEFRPRAPQLIRAGANLGGRDFYGRQFYQAPNIGAVEDVTDTPRYALTE